MDKIIRLIRAILYTMITLTVSTIVIIINVLIFDIFYNMTPIWYFIVFILVNMGITYKFYKIID